MTVATIDRTDLLASASPALAKLIEKESGIAPKYTSDQIRQLTVLVRMRDGIRLATDLYLPPLLPAPAIIRRTPYGRADRKLIDTYMSFAGAGYVVVAQDCRGTGDSEPDEWDYYVFEGEDGFDCVDWVSRQDWCDGFIGGCGGSYVGQTQWCMATHPSMSAIAPQVSGLGLALRPARKHMFHNAFARAVGKGAGKFSIDYRDLESQILDETLAGGFFNERLYVPWARDLLEQWPSLTDMPPGEGQKWIWAHYCALSASGRAELIRKALGITHVRSTDIERLPTIFGHDISHDRHTLPAADPAAMAKSILSPALLITGWYDWGLNDTLATWQLLMQEADASVARRSRLLITPSAHNAPGYHEGAEACPTLRRSFATPDVLDALLHWYASVRDDRLGHWPEVTYFMMGAQEWRTAPAWPPPEAVERCIFFHGGSRLAPGLPGADAFDDYVYDPLDPTPTVGGSIVSAVYTPGSVDVSTVQARPDVLTYTSDPLEADLEVAGPLGVTLFAGSSACDTDFFARLSDVFPDGRAIQLQNGLARARYGGGIANLIEPERIYHYEIDLWATANRFKRGHRLRIDISSADFPRFERHSNRAGIGAPEAARQRIHYGPQHPSCLRFYALPTSSRS